MDTIARALGANTAECLGANVDVVNRTNAAGATGVGAIAAARADGDTIGLITFQFPAHEPMGMADCLTSAPNGQTEGFEKQRISGSSKPPGSEDEQNIPPTQSEHTFTAHKRRRTSSSSRSAIGDKRLCCD